MSDKMSPSELVRIAIIWAEESMIQMIDGCDRDDPYRADVKDQLAQLRAYRDRRFGKIADPLEGAELVDMIKLRQQSQSSENPK